MILELSLKAGSWYSSGMFLLMFPYESAMERTPESEDANAPPNVPDERENAPGK